MRVKLNPKVSAVVSGATTSVAAINFPGFQEILDFTATGSEASVSVTVDGDTDKEYIALVRCITTGSPYVRLKFNGLNDNFGTQYIINSGGSISAGRETLYAGFGTSLGTFQILTPTGFPKTVFVCDQVWTSGTTISTCSAMGAVWNSTDNVTSLDFTPSTGNFIAETRITVHARRSNV